MTMGGSTVLIIAAVVSVASGLAALVAAAGELYGRPIATWSRSSRAVAAALLLVAGAALGSAHYSATTTKAPPPQVEGTSRQVESPPGGEAAVTASDAAAQAFTLTPTVSTTLDTPADPPSGASVVFETEEGRRLYSLEAAARSALNGAEHSVNGRCRFAITSGENLHGLITAKLAADIVITNRAGAMVTALHLTARGGGFDEESAKQQAIHRMAATIKDRLRSLA